VCQRSEEQLQTELASARRSAELVCTLNESLQQNDGILQTSVEEGFYYTALMNEQN
jgi:hypothetical protein